MVFLMYVLLRNDVSDEDVDISGNEPPMPSYTPVEIEKDTGHKSGECISSGSSNGKSYLLLCSL